MVPTLIWSGKWEHVAVRWSPTRPDLYGRSVRDLATERNVHPVDVLLDIAAADDFETQFAPSMANDDDDRLARMVAHPAAMIGASDAGAHVLSNTDSCYAVWTLQHWVRDRGVLTLEHAVRKLTADQADLLGFADRGRVLPGYAADLVLFDPDTVGTTGVRFVADQPAGGRRLVTDATGIVASVVNGTVATRDGESTGARTGRFLRSLRASVDAVSYETPRATHARKKRARFRGSSVGFLGFLGFVGWGLGGRGRGGILVLDQVLETGGLDQAVARGAEQRLRVFDADGRESPERRDIGRLGIRELAARLRLSNGPVDGRGHARAFGDRGVEAVDGLVEVTDRGEVDRDHVGDALALGDALLEAAGEGLLRIDRARGDGIGRSVRPQPVVEDEEVLAGAAAVGVAVEVGDRGERERGLLRDRVGAQEPRVDARVLLAHHDQPATLLDLVRRHHVVERRKRGGTGLRASTRGRRGRRR